MSKKSCTFRMLIGFMLLFGLWSSMFPARNKGEKVVLYPKLSQEKLKIDGELNEAVWKTPPLEGDFTSYSPHVGEKLPYETLVWTAYDKENIYFAFKCLDPEPDKIKTAPRRRDYIFNDDWVGLSLDSRGTKQTAWGLYVNASGSQGDLLDSAVTGSDYAPDLVWDSAGKVTDEGYQIEVSIPLRSLGFKSGEEVKMGVLFWRRVVRLGIRASWPRYIPGGKVFGTHTALIYKDLKKPMKLDLLPNVVYGTNQQRANPDKWGDKDDFSGIGLDIQHGLTSTITAGVTINPDFSQVESDGFQVEVNQRYPLFYSEKRPFFMEGMDVFKFYTMPSGLGGLFTHAVHTRRILDPKWAGKLVGNIGKFTFGMLGAGDDQPGLIVDPENPDAGKQAFWGIARGKYSMGKDSYLGFLYSGREFGSDYNRVFGGDVLFRFLKHHRINVSYLNSSAPEIDAGSGNNHNFNMFYYWQTPEWNIQTGFEHIGTDFRMDSAFIRRKGVNHTQFFAAYNFLPKYKENQNSFIKQIRPGIQIHYTHDIETGMADSTVRFFTYAFLAKSISFWADYFKIKEHWKGHAFDLNQYVFGTYGTLTKGLRLLFDFKWGDGIYYAGAPPIKGKYFYARSLMDLQPLYNLNMQFQYTHTSLKNSGQTLYDVNIYSSNNTYQFNKYLSLRAKVQYNDFQRKVLTDFLASYNFNIGTVLHIGYGSLYEGRDWVNDEWMYGKGDLLHVRRSFFTKISYLWRL